MQPDDILPILKQTLAAVLRDLQPLLDRTHLPLWLATVAVLALIIPTLILITSRRPRRVPKAITPTAQRLADFDPDRAKTRNSGLTAPADLRSLATHSFAGPSTAKPRPSRTLTPAPALPPGHRDTMALATPGDRTPDQDPPKALDDAETACRKALQALDPETSPQPWAIVMAQLSLILHAQSTQLDGEKGLAKLLESHATLTRAIERFDRESAPQDWAILHNELGNILYDLGWRLTGDTRHYFEAAIEAYRNALLVVSPKKQRRDWAIVQKNLALTLDTLSGFFEGDAARQKLIEAEVAYRSALGVFTINNAPGAWAYVHYRLALVLVELASGAARREQLAQAERSLRQAQRVYTRKNHPDSWAEIQLGIVSVLADLADEIPGADGVKHLKQAALAGRQALEILTRQTHEVSWAFAQFRLATILYELGKRGDGSDTLTHLDDAGRAVDAAMQVATQDNMPLRWAGLHHLMALIELERSRHHLDDVGIQALKDAERHCLRALTATPRHEEPPAWAWCQSTLGQVLYEFALRLTGAEALQKLQLAEQAYLRALEVWTPDSVPDRHNDVQDQLKRVRTAMATHPPRP